MRFHEVMEVLVDPMRDGRRAKRAGWKNVSYIQTQWPDANSANTRPYLYGVDLGGERVPWLADPVALFAEDWELI